MQFLVLAYDGDDDGALGRRLSARAHHIALGDKMVAAGQALFGTAILDESGCMVGSMVVLEFPTRAELDAYLEREPYMTGGVWKDVRIEPCRVGPSFAALHR